MRLIFAHEEDWSIQLKRWQDKFLCYLVVYKRTVDQQLSMTTGETENSSGGSINLIYLWLCPFDKHQSSHSVHQHYT